MAKEKQSPVDTGYSYVIAVAAFFAHFLQYGFAWTVGVWYSVFMEELNMDSKYVALISSLNTASFYVAGPFSSFLINLFGARAVAILGTIIGCTGLITSMFANSVYVFYITFGVITGFGFGLSYMPGVTMVGFYFEKRRSLAMGAVVSGSGLGTFVFPNLITYLIRTYSLSGALLLIAGVSLHIIVIGCLYRPWVGERGITEEEIVEVDCEKQDIKSLASNQHLNGVIYRPDLTLSKPSLYSKPSLPISKTGLTISKPSLLGSNVTLNSMLLRRRMLSANPNFCRTASICDLQPGVLYGSRPSVNRSRSILNRSRSILNSRSLIGGSIQFLGDNAYTPMPENDASSMDDEEVRQGCLKTLNLGIFTNISYVSLCLNNLFVCFGLSIIYVHLGAYAEETLQLTHEQSSRFFSAIGIANFFGRFAFGALCQVPFFKPICVYSVAFFATGLVTELCPLVDNYVWVMCYAVSFGLLSGSFGALLPSVIIQVTELDKLTSAYGYLLVFEAVGTLLGAPLAGWLYDSSENYKTSFYLGGVFIILSALVMIYPLLYARDESEIEDELSQYEEKIADAHDHGDIIGDLQIPPIVQEEVNNSDCVTNVIQNGVGLVGETGDNIFSGLKTIEETLSRCPSASDSTSNTDSS